MSDRKVIFQGELQLMRWSESSTNGATVSFWVHPEDLESFKTLKARVGKQAGQRLAVVMVAIGDDEAVMQQPEEPAPAPAAPRPRATLPPLAVIAVRWCRSEVFQKWATDHYGGRGYMGRVEGEGAAKHFILDVCGLLAKHGAAASRKHLDTDPEAEALFHSRIRLPFFNYLRDNALDP